jgi:hypothetical protein
MITAFIAGIGHFFFKIGMIFSHLHYQVGLMTLDPHVIIRHFEYHTLFSVGRPLLTWMPV